MSAPLNSKITPAWGPQGLPASVTRPNNAAGPQTTPTSVTRPNNPAGPPTTPAPVTRPNNPAGPQTTLTPATRRNNSAGPPAPVPSSSTTPVILQPTVSAAVIKPLQEIQDSYTKVWSETCYTSLPMYDYLLSLLSPARGGASDTDRWTAGLTLLKRNTVKSSFASVAPQDFSINTNDPGLRALWENFSGLCTSFSIKVAFECKILNRVEFGDDGVHRLAWEKEGTEAVLIDSSARRAVGYSDAYAVQQLGENVKKQGLSTPVP